MNMQNLMAEAQKMQKELERINKDIESSVFEGISGAVKVMISGKNEVIKIEIIDSRILNEKETLEDMIMLAVNDALKKLNKTKEEKLDKYTGGMRGLF